MASKLNWLKNYPAHVLSERNGCSGKLLDRDRKRNMPGCWQQCALLWVAELNQTVCLLRDWARQSEASKMTRISA